MSLVNDMLNDLDERRAEQPAQKENLEWLAGSTGGRKVRRSPLYLIVSVSLLLFFVYFIAQQYLSRSSVVTADNILQEAKNNKVLPTQHVISTPVKATPKPQLPVLDAVTFERRGRETMVALAFTAKPDYQLTLQKGELLIHLANVDAQLPKSLAAVKAPLQSISFRQAQEQLIVVLDHGGGIKYRSQWVSEPLPQLQIFVAIPEAKKKPVIARSESTGLASEVDSAKAKAQPVEVEKQKAIKKSSPLTIGQKDSRTVQQARVELRTANRTAAVSRLQAFLEHYKNAPKSSGLLVELFIEQKRLADAQVILNGLKSQFSDSSELRRLQSHLYVLQSKPEQAVSLLLSKKPDIKSESAYYELLAMSAQRAKQYSLSIQVYKSLLRYDSSKGTWWMGLAISQDLYGQKADARGNFQQAIKAGRLSQSLRDYARRRHNALAGAVNDPLLESSEVESNVE